MPKLNFPFEGFLLTDQQDGTFHLVLNVNSEINANYLNESFLMISGVYVRYSITSTYFDLFIEIDQSNEFYEILVTTNPMTEKLAYAIDQKKLMAVGVGFHRNGVQSFVGLSHPVLQK